MIELAGDTSADTVQLYPVNFGVGQHFRAHTDEVADAAGRLQQIAGLKAHVLQHLIDGADDHGRGIKGGEGGFSGGGVLVLVQQGFQFGVLAVTLVKAVGQPAPAHILRQYRLFLRRGKPIFPFQLFKQTDGPDVVVEAFPRRPRADGVIGDAVLMPVCGGDFGMEDKGRHFAPAFGLGRGQRWLIIIRVAPIR